MPEYFRNISTTSVGVHYGEKLSPGARFAMGSVALGVGLIPFVWFQLADWYYWSFATIFAAIIIAVTGIGALAIFSMALAGEKSLSFDANRRVAFLEIRGPLYRRHREIPFRQIQRFEIVMRQSADFGTYPVLQMFVHNRRRPMELVELGEREEVEEWKQLLQRMVRTH